MNNKQRLSGLLSAFSLRTWLLVIAGLFLLIPADYFELAWLEVVALGLLAVGLLLAKDDFTAIHEYGIYIYYLLLVVFLAAIAMKWFA